MNSLLVQYITFANMALIPDSVLLVFTVMPSKSKLKAFNRKHFTQIYRAQCVDTMLVSNFSVTK